MIPETRYAKSGDVAIAYTLTREGNPVDLVWAPSTATHLGLDWEDPTSAECSRGWVGSRG